MDELEKAMAAPVEKKLGGETVTFAQLTVEILTAFTVGARKRHKGLRAAEIAERRDELDLIKDLSPYDHGRLMMEVCNSIPPFDLAAALQEIDGAAEVLTISAKVHDPAMTVARMRALLPFDVQIITDLVNELLPVGPVTPEEQQAETIRSARGRLTTALAQKDTAEGNVECRACVGDAIKILDKALGEDGPPAEAASA